MLMLKYIVHLGYVKSRVDRDRSWVSSERLMRLYDVNPKECVVELSSPVRIRELKRGVVRGLIHLFPRSDGRYKEMKSTS